MKDEGSDNVSWKVLGVVAVVVFGLVFGIIYAEYIHTDSEEPSQYNQTDTEETSEQANQPPTAEFDVTHTSGEAPLEVTFDASDSFDEDGDITNYNWYFGGGTDSGETATFTYESSGDYSAKLVVEDDDGATDSFSQEIEVTSGEPEDATNADEEDSSSESSGDEWFSYSEYADIDEDDEEAEYESSNEREYADSDEEDYGDSDEEDEYEEDTDSDDKSLAYKLGTINSGYVEEDDRIVTRFEYLLDTLVSKTENTRQEVADMSVKAVQVLEEEYGVEVKLIDFMEGANDSIPPDAPEMDYAEISAAMITMMK